MIEESEHLPAHCEIDLFVLLVWQALLNISRNELEISAHCTQIEAQCECELLHVHVNAFQIISERLNLLQWSVWLDDCDVRHVSTWSQRWDSLTDNETRVCVWIFFQRFQYDEKLEVERHIRVCVYIYIQLLLHICVVFSYCMFKYQFSMQRNAKLSTFPN